MVAQASYLCRKIRATPWVAPDFSDVLRAEGIFPSSPWVLPPVNYADVPSGLADRAEPAADPGEHRETAPRNPGAREKNKPSPPCPYGAPGGGHNQSRASPGHPHIRPYVRSPSWRGGPRRRIPPWPELPGDFLKPGSGPGSGLNRLITKYILTCLCLLRFGARVLGPLAPFRFDQPGPGCPRLIQQGKDALPCRFRG